MRFRRAPLVLHDAVVRTALAALVGLAAGAAGCGGEPRPRLVLLLSVDTLRADRLGAYGSDRGLTPNLDELAARSEVFELAYAPAPFTVPSMSSVHTGRHPQQNGIAINEHILPESEPTLAEALHGAGFRTGAVVSNYVLRRKTGLAQGFERYDDRQRQMEAVRSMPERIAPHTTDDALKLLDVLLEDGQPVFLWVHYQDPHGPYTPPAELLTPEVERERALPDGQRRLNFRSDHRGMGGIPNYQRLGDQDEAGFYRGGYDAEIRYTDAEIGRLLDGLDARGLSAETLIVFLADHGEGLGEDDYWFAHGEYLSDALVRVPLFVSAPGRAPGRRSEVVGLIDVLPTLLGLVGVRAPDGVTGRDIFERGPRDSTLYLATLGGSTVPRRALVDEGYKYLIEMTPRGSVLRERLFRLGDESRDLATTEPQRAQTMRARLDAMARIRPDNKALLQERSREEREQLRKLGYVDGAPEEQDPGG